MPQEPFKSGLALFIGGFKDGERSKRATFPDVLRFKRVITIGLTGPTKGVEEYRLAAIRTAVGNFPIYLHETIPASEGVIHLLSGYMVAPKEDVVSVSEVVGKLIHEAAPEDRPQFIANEVVPALKAAQEANRLSMLPDTRVRITVSLVPGGEEVPQEEKKVEEANVAPPKPE